MGFISNPSPVLGNDPNDLPRKIEVDENGAVKTSLVSSLTKQLTDKAVTANTNIDTDYNPSTCQKSTLMVMADTSGVLSLVVNGKIGALNSGVALNANQWYAFDIPLTAGLTHNLQLSVGATMQINWIGGV